MSFRKAWLERCVRSILESAAEAQIAVSDLEDAGEDIEEGKKSQALNSLKEAVKAADFSLEQFVNAIALAEGNVDEDLVSKMRQECFVLASLVCGIKLISARAELGDWYKELRDEVE